MNWTQRTFIIVIVLLYVVIAGALVYFAYSLSPPTTADQYKEFAVRAGIALTATSAFVGVIVSFFTLSAQIRAARDLEVLKGTISRHNDFLNRMMDAKSVAYDKLFMASTNCYRELQNLAKGQYEKGNVAECERGLREAEALAANLDDEDRAIVTRVVQTVFNIIDEVESLRLRGDATKKAYEDIWNKSARCLGQAIEDLRKRSLFHNKSIGGSLLA